MNPPKNIYFEQLLKNVEKPCKERGIILDFTGYDDLVERLKNFTIDNLNEAWEISKECNAWCEYFGDIKAIIQQELANIEADKKSIISASSVKADSAKVANGERLANSDPEVVAIRKKRNSFEALLGLLEDKLQFLIQSHYFARSTCDWSQKCLTEKNK